MDAAGFVKLCFFWPEFSGSQILACTGAVFLAPFAYVFMAILCQIAQLSGLRRHFSL